MAGVVSIQSMPLEVPERCRAAACCYGLCALPYGPLRTCRSPPQRAAASAFGLPVRRQAIACAPRAPGRLQRDWAPLAAMKMSNRLSPGWPRRRGARPYLRRGALTHLAGTFQRGLPSPPAGAPSLAPDHRAWVGASAGPEPERPRGRRRHLLGSARPPPSPTAAAAAASAVHCRPRNSGGPPPDGAHAG